MTGGISHIPVEGGGHPVRARPQADQALVSDEAGKGRLHPLGFDPSRKGGAYYNEIDPFAAAWLRELIAAGQIALGVVDERDIRDVQPSDLAGFVQCHFFAGIGVWSYALRRAGWPDDRPVWTASLPCQPWSDAGSGGGFDDERHLWPAFNALRLAVRPVVCVGEQVASKAGLAWLDAVQADVEASGDAFGAIDLCSAGFGAPHIRQRLHWVAITESQCGGAGLCDLQQAWDGFAFIGDSGAIRWLADANGGDAGAEWEQRSGQQRQLAPDGCVGIMAHTAGGRQPILRDAMGPRRGRHADGSFITCGLGNASGAGTGRVAGTASCQEAAGGRAGRENGYNGGDASVFAGANGRPGPTNGIWREADWLLCTDGKWRPVEPGTFPLANGTPARVGRLRGYGNAINAEVATAFIEAVIDVLPCDNGSRAERRDSEAGSSRRPAEWPRSGIARTVSHPPSNTQEG